MCLKKVVNQLCIQDDLVAVARNSEVLGLTDDCVAIVADIPQSDVYLVSAKQVPLFSTMLLADLTLFNF